MNDWLLGYWVIKLLSFHNNPHWRRFSEPVPYDSKGSLNLLNNEIHCEYERLQLLLVAGSENLHIAKHGFGKPALGRALGRWTALGRVVKETQ